MLPWQKYLVSMALGKGLGVLSVCVIFFILFYFFPGVSTFDGRWLGAGLCIFDLGLLQRVESIRNVDPWISLNFFLFLSMGFVQLISYLVCLENVVNGRLASNVHGNILVARLKLVRNRQVTYRNTQYPLSIFWG
ncbi:hypothetical protein CC78DRAFT_353100 [Lojkania enalia]|uniref:Uncharacterized protein n=1 Tax=Lojkania enalia TaxID=147567 RepID=A0A9P4KIQ2_9PLEO|nr:hypothetical protein CC78DRAFT_353100 [Didymosphaeria enalia]